MIVRALVLPLAVLLSFGCTDRSKPKPTPPSTEPKASAPNPPEGQLDDTVTPIAYRLDLTLIPSAPTFTGEVDIRVRFSRRTDRFFLHGLDLSVQKATVTQDGQSIEVDYEQVEPTGVAEIKAPRPLDQGDATLHFEYTAPFNRKLQGIYRVDDGGQAYAFTQFEAISARLAFPSFDEPRFKTPFDITVTALEDHAVITTTPETGRDPAKDGKVTRRFATTKPLPTYLLAFAVGPLDVVEHAPIPPTAIRERPIPLRGIAAKGKGPGLATALADTAQIVMTHEDYFGIAYPYEKLDLIAAPDYAFGAMENAGAIVYREERLLIARDAPAQQRRAYLKTHSHEIAHQWFGNLVTPKWWTDIWLNESFASWSGNRAVAVARPKEAYDRVTTVRAIETMKQDALASARRIREPVKRNLEIWNAFDAITYRKGGGILAMFEQFLGPDTFRAGIRAHMHRFEHGVADANEFIESLVIGAKRPEIIPAFRSFIEQPGVPMLNVTPECKGPKPELRIAQSRYAPLGSSIDRRVSWEIPMCFVTFGPQGRRSKTCKLITRADEAVPLPTCPAAVLPNAGGAGYFHFALPPKQTQALLAQFDRLEPSEQLAVFSSVEAAFRAGNASIKDLLRVAQLASGSSAWDVQKAPLNILSLLLAILDGSNETVRRDVLAMYGPLTRKVGVAARRGESDDAELIRPNLIAFMALSARDAATRKALLPIADRHLDSRSRANEKAVAKIALAVAATERGSPFIDRILEQLKTQRDGFARSERIFALAHAEGDQQQRVLAQILSEDLRVNETIGLVRALFAYPPQQTAILRWVDKNFDELMARLPSQFQGRILASTDSLCDVEAIRQIEAFETRAVDLQGAPRHLMQAKEAVGLCVALKSHLRTTFLDR